VPGPDVREGGNPDEPSLVWAVGFVGAVVVDDWGKGALAKIYAGRRSDFSPIPSPGKRANHPAHFI
jgi:hypothetical protein